MVNINILTIFLFFAFLYYFNRFNELRRTHKRIFDKVNHLWIDNQKLRVKMKELQSYKNDVSKTFKILDTELNMINEHLKIRQDHQPMSSFNGNVSLLTPEILTNLMENINQEEIEPLQLVPQQEVEDPYLEQQEQQEVEEVEDPYLEQQEQQEHQQQEDQEVEEVEDAYLEHQAQQYQEQQEVEEHQQQEDEDSYLEQQEDQSQDQSKEHQDQQQQEVETGREEISNKDLFQLHPFDNDLSQYFINISENNTEQSSIKELVNEVINNVVQ
jgi:hypothetical protein